MTKAGSGGESRRACFVQSSANRAWRQIAWTLDQPPTGTGSHAEGAPAPGPHPQLPTNLLWEGVTFQSVHPTGTGPWVTLSPNHTPSGKAKKNEGPGPGWAGAESLGGCLYFPIAEPWGSEGSGVSDRRGRTNRSKGVRSGGVPGPGQRCWEEPGSLSSYPVNIHRSGQAQTYRCFTHHMPTCSEQVHKLPAFCSFGGSLSIPSAFKLSWAAPRLPRLSR